MYTYPGSIYLSQVVWAAYFRFIPCYEADILRKCNVGHLLLQQTEGWSNLQSLLPGHPKSRFECSHKQTKACAALSMFYKSCVICSRSCWNDLFPLISICRARLPWKGMDLTSLLCILCTWLCHHLPLQVVEGRFPPGTAQFPLPTTLPIILLT